MLAFHLHVEDGFSSGHDIFGPECGPFDPPRIVQHGDVLHAPVPCFPPVERVL